jgi:hypothetical protein
MELEKLDAESDDDDGAHRAILQPGTPHDAQSPRQKSPKRPI